RRALGRPTAEDGDDLALEPRHAAPQGAAPGHARHEAARLPPPDRPRRARSTALRAARRPGAAARPGPARRVAAGGAFAVARGSTRRPRLRDVRRGRDPAAR